MSKLRPIYCYVIIILAAFAVFSNTLKNEFVFDDDSVIVTNLSLQSLSNIPLFFTADEGFHKVIGRYYRPIVSASYAIDYSIWGLNPMGFHLTNIIINIISCLLLFKILTLLFWRYKYRNLFALLSTLIFAVHPVHTEAVSWISGRTDSMVTMFFFASFLFYIEFTKEKEINHEDNTIRSVTGKNHAYLYLSLLFYVAGLLTKEMIITMPVIILLYDFVYRKKNKKYFKDNLNAYILFGAVTVVYLILRYLLLNDIPERESYLYFYKKDFITAFATMLKTVPVYFRLLFAPFGLLYHYNGVVPDSSTLTDVNVILSALFIVFLILISVYYFKKDSIISFCILFFLLSLLPVMNIIPTMNLMAERFLYFSSFALVLLICHLSLTGSSKRDFSFLIIGLVVIICSLSYLTYSRNADWANNNKLYLSAKGVEGTVLLVNEGNIYANNKEYDKAEKLYKRAIEIRDNNLLAHHNLGLIYLLKNNLDSAGMKFKKGISLDSLAPDGYFQLATLYNIRGNKDSAIILLEKLQKVFPDYKQSAQILNELKSTDTSGNSSTELFGTDETKNVRINMLQRRSYQFFSEKKYEDAINDLEQLILLNDDPKAKSGFMNNIAMCYAELNNEEMQEKYFLNAVELDKNNINAMNGLASFYAKKNQKDKALNYLNQILLLNPSDEIARKKLDSLSR